MEVVLVHWYVQRGREAEFVDFRKPVPVGTDGFIKEDLYSRVMPGRDDVTEYVNVGQWETQEAFYSRLSGAFHKQPFEVEDLDRWREWFVPTDARGPVA